MKTKRKNIFKSLLALTLALIMVLGVAPLNELADVNWAGIFAPKAEATKSEILNYDLMEAEYITGKRSYPSSAHFSGNTANDVYRQYAKDDLYSPTVSMLDSIESDKTLSALLTTWKAYSLGGSPSSATGLIMDGVDYCETLLAMALKKTLSETAVTTVLKSEVLGDSKDLKEMFDSFCDTSESLDLSKDSEKIQSSLKKAVKDLYKDTPSKASKVEGAIGDFIKYSKNIVELCQKVATYSKMLDLDDFTKEWLNRMYEANEINGNDSDMRIALNNLIVASSGDSGFSDLSWARAGFTGVEWIVQKGIDEGIKILCRSNPVVAAIFAGLSIGSTICNLFFATDDICEQLYVMQKFEILQNIARSAMMKCQSGFELVRDIKSAQIFNKAVEMYFHIITDVDCDCMSEFLTKLYTGGYLKDITVKIKGASGDYESCTNAVEDLRNVRRNNYNYIITYCKGGFKLESEESYSYYFGEKSTEIPVESISLRQNNIEINMDGFLNLFPQYTPSDTTQKGVIYTSSDESIIPSGNTGILFPKKAGKVTITLTSIYDSSIKTSVTVTVTDSESGGGSGGSSGGSNIGIIDSGTYGGNLTWKLTEAGTLIISGTGAMKNCSYRKEEYEIPWYSYRSFIRRAVIANSVTSIGDYAFSGCSSLTSATIPNSVTSIGRDAFYYCNSLTSVIIPDSVTSIGLSAFEGCSSLTSVTIPNGVKSIESFAFRGCSSLISVTIPDSVTSIEWGAFEDCSSLTSVKIGNGVKSIGDDAFNGCSNLTSVTIPDSVTSIGSDAFYGCSGLTSVTIPDSVTSIGSDAFKDCSSLTSVTIGNGVTSTQCFTFSEYSRLTSVKIGNGVKRIRDDAFKGCSNLTSVTIGNSVTSIGDYAFSGCSSLTSVTIPNGVMSIEECTFYDCSSLANVTIPDSVTSIGEYAFEGCSSLKSVTIPNGVTNIGQSTFSGCSSLKSVTIPNSITSIGYRAFFGCSSLTSVTIPNGVKSIESDAFCGCSSLTSVTIPNGVKSIESFAFGGCSSLTSVTIPDSVTEIKLYAFEGCSSLASVTIPDSVTSIEDNAFKDCSSLTSVTIGNNVTSIGWSAFEGCGSLESVTIPDSVTSIRSDTFSGCSSLTSVTIGNNVTSIGWAAFEGCSSLTSVMIGNSVTSIIDRAFHDCSSLTSITIPDSVTSIGEDAFWDCSSLESVTIGNSVTSIGDSAFEGCSGLKSVNYTGTKGDWCKISFGDRSFTANPVCYAKCLYVNGEDVGDVIIPNDVTRINPHTFYNCKNLTSITIPNSVTSIGEYAFYGCNSLTSVTIPDSVTSIGEYAFYDCDSLTGVTIPDGVTSIGEGTFKFCSSLTSVTIPDSVTSIGDGAFDGCNGLTSIIIPNSVTSIGDSAFEGCSGLTSITIPNSVTSIGNFAFDGCTGLTSITIPNSVTSIENGAFFFCISLESVTIPDSVTSIGSSAFDYCKYLKDVYYCGTEAQWEKITIGDDNNCLTNATIHFNWKPCTHKWSSWQTVTAPTVDSEGLEKRVCSKCGAEETRAISKLEPVAVTSVKLSKSKKSLNIGDTFTLTATVKPNNATDKSVTWSSSDTSVATVDENGVVTAVAEGTATITATASNGVEASCTVTVKQKGDSFFKKILNVVTAPFRAIINLFKKLFGK